MYNILGRAAILYLELTPGMGSSHWVAFGVRVILMILVESGLWTEPGTARYIRVFGIWRGPAYVFA